MEIRELTEKAISLRQGKGEARKVKVTELRWGNRSKGQMEKRAENSCKFVESVFTESSKDERRRTKGKRGVHKRAMQDSTGEMKRVETEKTHLGTKDEKHPVIWSIWSDKGKDAAITGQNGVGPCKGHPVTIWSHLVAPSARARWRIDNRQSRIEMKHPHGFAGGMANGERGKDR